MSRSIENKGIYVHPSIIKKIKRGDKTIKTWSRDSLIIPSFIGKVFQVHNGNKFISFEVDENRLWCLLGEFALSKKPANHSQQLRNKFKHIKSIQSKTKKN